MAWVTTYYNASVQKDAYALPEQVKAKFESILDEMEQSGPNLGLPFTKALGRGLFEIRAKAHEGIARGMFCTICNNTIVVLHVFVKKTQKIPKHDLDLSIQRMNEVKRHGL